MIDTKQFSLHLAAFSLVFISWVAFIMTHSIYAWAIIPVFSGLAILIGKPSSMLWYGLGWFMVTQFAQSEMRVGFFNYVDEFVTLVMLAVLFVQVSNMGSSITERMRQVQPMQKIAFSFVVLVIFSAVLNHAIDIFFVMWCFQYLRMFVVFFFAIRFLRQRDFGIFIRFLMAFSGIDLLLNLGWWFGINPLPNSRVMLSSDFGVGTFAACDQVAYFCILVIVLCLAIIIDPPSKKTKRMASWLLVITFIDFMITNTIHAYFLLFPAIGVFFVVNYRVIIKVASWPTLLLIMAAGALNFFFLISYTDAGAALKPEYVAKRYEQFFKEPKMVSYRRNIAELPRESSYFWFIGHGPGQAGSSIGRALRRPIADKYFNAIYNEEQYRSEAVAGSITSGEQTGILTYWSELGPLGLIMLILSHLVVLSKTMRRLHTHDYSNKYQLALARTFPSVVAVIFLIAFIRDMFYIAWIVGVFWVWAALVLIPKENKPEKKSEVVP